MGKLADWDAHDDWKLANHLEQWDAHTAEAIREHLRQARKHQHYANFETFSVGLVLDNDRLLLEVARALCTNAYQLEPDPELRRAHAAQLLKDWVTDCIGIDSRPPHGAVAFDGLASTLVAVSLSEVDWLELAAEHSPEEVAKWQ